MMRQASFAIGAASLCLVLATSGCPFPIPDLDLDAPRVVSSSPVGSATTIPTISVTFSKPVLHEKFDVTNMFVLVRTEDITSTFLSDLNSPPLLASRQALVVGGTLSVQDINDRTVLTFVPARPLEGETSYTYLVSRSVTDEAGSPLVVPLLDEEGEEIVYPDGHPVAPGDPEWAAQPGSDRGGHPTNPGEPVYVAGHFRAAFVTGRAIEVEGPQVIERFPDAGARNVPPNLAAARVRFNEPAYNVTTVTFQVVAPDGSAAPASQVELTDGRTRAALLLSSDLQLSTEYRMVLREGIEDETGNNLDQALNESTFTTASCLDSDAPVIDPLQVTAVPVDTYALLRWRTNEPATSAVRYGLTVPDTLVEGGTGRCTLVNYDPCVEPPMDAVCLHEVRVDGLTPETGYVFQVESLDAAGNASTSDIFSFETLAPLPPLVVNEIMATPDAAPQEAAEFVEVFNAGTDPVDLDGWIIADTSVSPERTQALAALGPALTVLEPGAYAIIVGQAFDPSNYPSLGTNVILAGSGNRLLTYGLADDRGLLIELRSPQGALVSSYGGWFRGTQNRGRSIERIDPTGADVLENWTWALDPPGATPGNKNSVTP